VLTGYQRRRGKEEKKVTETKSSILLEQEEEREEGIHGDSMLTKPAFSGGFSWSSKALKKVLLGQLVARERRFDPNLEK
jgi:hypothetical protein